MELLPGLLQGITRVTISYPADIVKVQMQKQLFPDTISTVKHIVKNDIFKFYRGASIPYVTTGLERSLQFYYLERLNKKYNPYLSGFMVSIFSSIYNLPAQYLTTNIAILNKGLVRKFIKETPIRKMYTGYFIETPKNILGSSIFLGTYMKLRSKTNNKLLYPLFGAFSGLIVWLIIYPIDTIKTEVQTQKNSLINIAYNRYLNYGFRSFYRGITPVLLRTFPSAYMGMYVYEKTREIIN